MLDESFWREAAREVIPEGEPSAGCGDAVDPSTAIVQRLFTVAVQCAGGAPALIRHLRITYSELRTYLGGTAMPPEAVLLRALELVIEHRKPRSGSM